MNVKYHWDNIFRIQSRSKTFLFLIFFKLNIYYHIFQIFDFSPESLIFLVKKSLSLSRIFYVLYIAERFDSQSLFLFHLCCPFLYRRHLSFQFRRMESFLPMHNCNTWVPIFVELSNIRKHKTIHANMHKCKHYTKISRCIFVSRYLRHALLHH